MPPWNAFPRALRSTRQILNRASITSPFSHARSVHTYPTPTASPPSPAPRHFLSLSTVSPAELAILINNATAHKTAVQSGSFPSSLSSSLLGGTTAILFNKRSTRTRVSTEGAICRLGGTPMFLSASDIQLGVNESLRDTSIIISSMTNGIVARVAKHSDIQGLAEYSSVPVINALCDCYHPMQIIADFACLSQTLNTNAQGLKGIKIAWVGDANNVLFDMCIGAKKLGIDMSVATPRGYQIPGFMQAVLNSQPGDGGLQYTHDPMQAVKDADVIVTDTWISMGQEAETQKRLKDFEGYQVTEEMARKGGAKGDWKFMHCLPRHKEEVSDEVFYGQRSLVFPEGQNRLWSALSVLEAFLVNKGDIKKTEIGV